MCAQYLAKGRTVYIEGRLQTREWENKEGQKQRTTEINAQTIQFLGGGPRAAGPGGPARPRSGAGGGGTELDPGPPDDARAAAPPDDEIPF